MSLLQLSLGNWVTFENILVIEELTSETFEIKVRTDAAFAADQISNQLQFVIAAVRVCCCCRVRSNVKCIISDSDIHQWDIEMLWLAPRGEFIIIIISVIMKRGGVRRAMCSLLILQGLTLPLCQAQGRQLKSSCWHDIYVFLNSPFVHLCCKLVIFFTWISTTIIMLWMKKDLVSKLCYT